MDPNNQSIVIASAAQADAYAGVAAFVFLAWDVIIHLDEEVKYMWHGPNTWIKGIYFFIRHFPVLAQASLVCVMTSASTGIHFSSAGCRGWITSQAIVMESLTIAVEVVLVLRIYALYHYQKVVLWILGVLFAAEIAAMITSLCFTVPHMVFNPQCLTISAPSIFMAYWLSSLAFETILFSLTLIKFFLSVSKYLGKQSILYIFVRDGTWAFALIFVAMLLNTLMYQLNRTPLAGICYFWALCIMSFAGSHILLNLRRLAMEGNHAGTAWSTIVFQQTESHTTRGHLSLNLEDDSEEIPSGSNHHSRGDSLELRDLGGYT